jgi:hypothetical protein
MAFSLHPGSLISIALFKIPYFCTKLCFINAEEGYHSWGKRIDR